MAAKVPVQEATAVTTLAQEARRLFLCNPMGKTVPQALMVGAKTLLAMDGLASNCRLGLHQHFCCRWLSDFKTKTSFGFLIEHYMEHVSDFFEIL